LAVQAVAQASLTSGMLVLTSGQLQNQEVVGVEGNVVGTCAAYGSYGGTAPIWTVGAASEYQVLGIDAQPILMTPVLVSALVP
jgi:hypothetical protein